MTTFVLYREQCACMSGGDVALLNHLPNGSGKRQHTKQICDGGAILPHCVSDLLLRELELLDQALIAFGLFERVQICALEILDKSQREHGPIIEVADNGWDFGPAEASSSA
ncbi:MAG: hypothetical protein ABI664_00115 [bacterium]